MVLSRSPRCRDLETNPSAPGHDTLVSLVLDLQRSGVQLQCKVIYIRFNSEPRSPHPTFGPGPTLNPMPDHECHDQVLRATLCWFTH